MTLGNPGHEFLRVGQLLAENPEAPLNLMAAGATSEWFLQCGLAGVIAFPAGLLLGKWLPRRDVVLLAVAFGVLHGIPFGGLPYILGAATAAATLLGGWAVTMGPQQSNP